MPGLEHVILNLIPIDPERAGGVAMVCRMMARHMPESLPYARTLVLTGGHSWEPGFPLEGHFERMDFSRQTARTAGPALIKRLRPDWFHALRAAHHRLAFVLKKPVAFPAPLASHTVVHVPFQTLHPLPPRHWLLPYVMNLHDLQHEHFPEFFEPKELARRRRLYLASAKAAQAVVVVDEWTKRDLLCHLDLPEDKVFVGPFGPTWPSPQELSPDAGDEVRRRYALPTDFMFYPAQTWPHKNHRRLLDAMATARNAYGLEIHLACTGHQNEFFETVKNHAEEAGLSSRVHFLGLIPLVDIQALYRAARFTIIPTLFEGGPGIPVQEALSLGSPLAAATSCGIPDCVGYAALLFNPLEPAEMAAAIARLWTDPELRADLAARGKARAAGWTWERTGAIYADIYREALARWNRRNKF